MAYMRSPHGLRPLAILCGATIALLSTAAGPTPTARAGTFTAWYCRTGSNAGLVLQDWVRETANVQFLSVNPDACITPDGRPNAFGLIVGGNTNDQPVTDALTILAPPDLRLSSVRLWWSGTAKANGQVTAGTVAPGRAVTDPFVNPVASYGGTSFNAGVPVGDGAAPTTFGLDGAQGFSIRSQCLTACYGDPSTIAAFEVARAAFSVADASPPKGYATGDLLVDSVLVGQKSVIVDGNDPGAGVYLARVIVDGQVRASGVFGNRTCRDVDSSNADPYEFAYVQPCPTSGSVAVALDTTQVGEDAYHRVQVELVDAAGNSVVLADRYVGVDNQPLPASFFDPSARRFLNPAFSIRAARRVNGLQGGSGANLRLYFPVVHRAARAAGTRIVAFAARATVRGQLTDAGGRPLAGAQVWLATRAEGGEWRIDSEPLITGRTGEINFRLAGRLPSRSVNLVYFPYSDSHEQATGRPLSLKVRAGAVLRTDRHVLRNGQRVTFVGSIRGAMPAGGLSISLQAQVGHRYRSFRQLRVTPQSRGRFKTSYRFTATTRTTRYRFRVSVLKQSGMPFENGTSAVRTVLVRP
ncbi:MAG: hypothetical protein QOI62_1454 [Solirubrobacteraceae bacterium]|jgi:hypothetical protein|nr:hypothetical protein [Solirubrobacteraceae bacterium]